MADDVFGASLDEILTAFGPGAGALQPMPEPFSDFWGVVTDLKTHVAEFENEDEETGVKTVRITPMLRFEILVDNGPAIWEDFSLPVDRNTGQVRRNADGSVARPNEESKWGKQEMLLVNGGLSFQGASDLIGIHAHFKRMDIPLKGRGNRSVKGRFIIEWDGYNNSVRSEHGLESRRVQPTETPAVESVVTNYAGESKAVELLVEAGTFMGYLGAIKSRGLNLGDGLNTRGKVDSWVDAGYVAYDMETRRYTKGPKFEEVVG